MLKQIFTAAFSLAFMTSSYASIYHKDDTETVFSSAVVVQPLGEAKLKMEIEERYNSAITLGQVYFKYESAKLSIKGKKALANIVFKFKKKPYSFMLEGYCDERGTDQFNFQLGNKRAESVKKYLVEQGIAESYMTIISYGKTKADGMSKKNRRVDVKVFDDE